MPLRSDEMKEKYAEHRAQYENFSRTKDYREDHERIIRSYEHWYIIQNLFPYDKITKAHNMLVPKRVFSKMSECNKSEWSEYKIILNQLEDEGYYDAILENFSRNRSIYKHLHLHLLVWKDTPK